MARLAASMALVLLFVAFAYATDDSSAGASTAASTNTPPKSYFTAPVIALSPAQQEEVAEAPSSEDESDPDAGTVGSSGAHYPPATGNIEALAPSSALSPSDAHAPSSKGVSTFQVSSAAATVSVIAVAGYFAF